MPRAIEKLAPFQGVGAAQTASVMPPRGLTYERFYLKANVGGTPVDVPATDWGTYFDEIRIEVDGDVPYRVDAADIASIAKYHGQTLSAGVLPIFLDRPWMKTVQGGDETVYGTQGVGTFSLEVDIKSGVTINSLEAFALKSPARPWGKHLAMRKYRIPHGVTGESEFADILRGNYGLYGMHLKSADAANIKVLGDTREFFNMDKAMRDVHSKTFGKTPQTGFAHVDFAGDRSLDALPMAFQDFRMTVDFTGTGNSVLYTEAIEP